MDPFIAEIRIFPCNFAPLGWSICAGQILPIAQNTALFSLLGTQYGGNGTSTFGLPDMRGHVGVGQGQGPGLSTYSIGEMGGEENVTLISTELPVHNHNVNCYNDAGEQPGPANNFLAAPGADRSYVMFSAATSGTNVTMNPGMLLPAGSNQPHNNMSPYLTLNYCIALNGIYPARN